MMRWILLLVIAMLCGSIGAKLAGHKGPGCLGSMVLGFIGALIGSWLSEELQIPDFLYFHQLPVLWSVIGAALFVALIGMLAGNRRR
jgi:uncharacterized membrane protein YeaQ/YmgE (transglycosylase-associated protein family)